MNSYLTLYRKINFKWVTDQRFKYKTKLKTSKKKNIEENLCGLELSKDFLDMPQTAQYIIEPVKWTLSKFKTSLPKHLKDEKTSHRGNTCKGFIWQTDVSREHKEHLKLN